MNKFLQFIRAKQWIKNGFVAIPFVLSLKFLEFNLFNYFSLFIAVLSFCLISSSIYIFNDICDIKEDRNHPKKRQRALASGQTSIFAAIVIAVIFAMVALFIVQSFFNKAALVIMLFYIFNNVLYSVKIKHFAIFDVMMISIGFVLRVLYGIFCFQTPISKWIMLLTFTICLFLALTKRRKDFETDGYLRKALKGYTVIMLDKFIVISAVLAIACYVMYVNEMVNVTGNYYFMVTNVFVVFGIFRYLQAIHLNTVDTGESGIILYKDMVFLINIVLWAGALLLCLISDININPL